MQTKEYLFGIIKPLPQGWATNLHVSLASFSLIALYILDRWSNCAQMHADSIIGPNCDLFNSYKKWLNISKDCCLISTISSTANWISPKNIPKKLILMRTSLVPVYNRSLIRMILNILPSSLILLMILKMRMISASLDFILHRNRSPILKVIRLMSSYFW